MVNFRKALDSEIPQLIELRKKQRIDEGSDPDPEVDEYMVPFFKKHFSDGSLVEWVAEEDGQIVATAAILFMEFPPAYSNPSGVRGYITNMYTSPDYRGKGIATSLLEKLMDEARERNIYMIFLGASKMGKPVYRKFGFEESGKWMDLSIKSRG